MPDVAGPARRPERVVFSRPERRVLLRVFDRIDPKTIDRRHWQLSMLPIGIIIILAVGMALLMYPATFAHQALPAKPLSPTLYFSFCALSVLLVLYLVNRQLVVYRLYNKLAEEKREIALLREKASADLLSSLSGFTAFQDRLTMGFRRATQTNEPLSLILVLLKPAPQFDNTPEMAVALGDSARVLMSKLRGEDSLYRLGTRQFGCVLPNTGATEAARTATRVSEGLTDASGASDRFSFKVQVVNFPDQVASAYEMEKLASAFPEE
jgi:GGDEF domain-containing protein